MNLTKCVAVYKQTIRVCYRYKSKLKGGLLMTDLFSEIQESLKGTEKTIVLPEGTDERVLQAAARLQIEGLVKPILLGNEDEVKSAAATKPLSI